MTCTRVRANQGEWHMQMPSGGTFRGSLCYRVERGKREQFFGISASQSRDGRQMGSMTAPWPRQIKVSTLLTFSATDDLTTSEINGRRSRAAATGNNMTTQTILLDAKALAGELDWGHFQILYRKLGKQINWREGPRVPYAPGTAVRSSILTLVSPGRCRPVA